MQRAYTPRHAQTSLGIESLAIPSPSPEDHEDKREFARALGPMYVELAMRAL